jgi:hypothetical protein
MGVNRKPEQQYIIQVELTADAGQSTSTMPATAIGSYPFRWEHLGATWGTDGDWDIRIRDASKDYAFSPGFVTVSTLVGSTDKKPWPLDHPHVFGAGSGIMIEAKNNGAGTDTLKLAFIGQRLPQM